MILKLKHFPRKELTTSTDIYFGGDSIGINKDLISEFWRHELFINSHIEDSEVEVGFLFSSKKRKTVVKRVLDEPTNFTCVVMNNGNSYFFLEDDFYAAMGMRKEGDSE